MNPVENKAIFHTLAGIADSQPLVRMAIKYWWLAGFSGVVMYYRIKKRSKVDLPGVLEDFAFSFGPILPLIMISETMSKNNPPVVATPSVTVKEAQFQMVPGSAPAPAASAPTVTATPQPFPS